jgi:expansin (peptidoglycan-binding protein)
MIKDPGSQNPVTQTYDEIRFGATLADVVPSAATAEDIPEPATMALLGLAAAGMGGYLRRRRAAGVVTLVIVAMFGVSAQAGIVNVSITNPSFETNVLADGAVTSVTGWTTNGWQVWTPATSYSAVDDCTGIFFDFYFPH